MSFSKLPNFFILGAAKSGTTSLADYLRDHPQVYIPLRKELAFFNNDEHFERGVSWYSDTFFGSSEKYIARGDATPQYLYWGDKVAPRLKELYGEGNVRFIVSFRDPVNRAYSGYWNAVKEGTEALTFSEALAEEPQRLWSNEESMRYRGTLHYAYFDAGRYATQLKPYLERFPRDRFLFLLHEDLQYKPETTLTEVFDFLRVDRSARVASHVSNPATMPRFRLLHKFIRNRSAIKELIKPLLPSSMRYRIARSIVQANLKKFAYPPIDEQLERTLRCRYHEEIEQLESMIDRDLSHWKAQN